MYQATVNLSLRLSQELTAVEDLRGGTLTEEQQEKLQGVNAKVDRLEHSLLYLDENLMLFVDH